MTHSLSLRSLGHRLATSDSSFDWCVSSRDIVDSAKSMRERLERDGYLYVPDYLDTGLVDEARHILLQQLDDAGLLDRSEDPADGIAVSPWKSQPRHHLTKLNKPLQSLLYSGRMLQLYERLFGGEVRHFDFTWLRVIGPGHGTAPHCDSVYMGRGTQQLCTSWTPLMEITPDIGGLTLMPRSHRLETLAEYRAGDVDTVCINQRPGEPQDVHQWTGPIGDGKLADNPVKLQQDVGLPWVTSECYRPGDVVIFSISTIHGSLDNQSSRVRLSTDSRYQLASEPADERWIGENPIGHGAEFRKEIIC